MKATQVGVEAERLRRELKRVKDKSASDRYVGRNTRKAARRAAKAALAALAEIESGS